MLHNLKLQRKYADRIIGGQKTFEVRLNDRDYQVGDIIIFNAIEKVELSGDYIEDYKDEKVDHKINNKEYEITYVHTDYGMDHKTLDREYYYVVLGIKPIKK